MTNERDLDVVSMGSGTAGGCKLGAAVELDGVPTADELAAIDRGQATPPWQDARST